MEEQKQKYFVQESLDADRPAMYPLTICRKQMRYLTTMKLYSGSDSTILLHLETRKLLSISVKNSALFYKSQTFPVKHQ